MKTIQSRAEGVIVVKKSRFIATLCPVKERSEAEAFVAEMKKKYWDARHNCSAYIVPSESGEPYVHSSDDGEPSGTAGKPMLAVLTGAGVCGVAAVVTRYFGGVLLGTGGLVRAYQDAVSEALREAAFLEEIRVRELFAETDYTLWGKLQSFLAKEGEILSGDPIYGEKVSVCLKIPLPLYEEYLKKLQDLTNGKAVLVPGDEKTVERVLPGETE